MEIVIHGHQTDITPSLRQRAEEGAHKLAEHLREAVDADIRFEEDGLLKTVEIVLHAPKQTRLVAKAEAKHHGPALTDAIAKLDAQIRKLKGVEKRQVHDGAELRA
ncbi:MAG TPA: ribosome-associated translation inhibitor RaiA [Gemmatimonadaceae bacterium]|jgi:ribosomal subunit interface protein|nr:ribosome-associated translation inhibitor RaiA [Gemmatimonadaceae bacterium]